MTDHEFDRVMRARAQAESARLTPRAEDKIQRAIQAGRKQSHVRVALLAAAIMLIGMTALAAANGLGILDFLGRGGKVQRDGAAVSEGGYSLCVTESAMTASHAYFVLRIEGEGVTDEKVYCNITHAHPVSVVNETVDSREADGAVYEFHSLSLAGVGSGEVEFRVSSGAGELSISCRVEDQTEARGILTPAGQGESSGIEILGGTVEAGDLSVTVTIDYRDSTYREESGEELTVWCDGKGMLHASPDCAEIAQPLSEKAPLSRYWAVEISPGTLTYTPDGTHHLCHACLAQKTPSPESGEGEDEPWLALEILDSDGNAISHEESSTGLARRDDAGAILRVTFTFPAGTAISDTVYAQIYDVGTKERFGAIPLLYFSEE